MSQPEVELEGCGSHSCVIKKPVGQGTNSGCLCNASTLRLHIQKLNRRPAPIDGGGLDWEKEFDDLIGSMYLTDSSGKNPLAFKEWWIYPDVKKFIRNLLSNRGGGLDEKIIRGYLAELAGSASLCWEPKPTGVFDSTQAMKFVDVAVDRIMKLGTPPTKGVCEALKELLICCTIAFDMDLSDTEFALGDHHHAKSTRFLKACREADEALKAYEKSLQKEKQ